jgi:hypothetical protein
MNKISENLIESRKQKVLDKFLPGMEAKRLLPSRGS